MENRKFNISVSIEGIQLPLTVSSAEEEKIYRSAASNIQGRVQKLRNMYPNLKNDKYYYLCNIFFCFHYCCTSFDLVILS